MARLVDKRFIDPLEDFSPWRAPLRWLSRWGMNLIAYFADTGGGGGLALDCPNPCNQNIEPVRCCFLACPHKECTYEGDKSNFQCPEPYQKTFWTCCDGGTLVGCGECACGDNCRSRPWFCSIAFDIGGTC